MLKPYHKQPKETGKAFEAFKVYLTLGPTRLLKQVAAQVKKNHKLIEQWSARWAWVERAAAWDAEHDAALFEDMAKAAKAANLKHLKLAEQLVALGIDRLPKPGIDPKTGKPYKGAVSPSEARLLISTAVDMERKALGIADNIKVDHTTKGKPITGMIVEYVDPKPVKKPKGTKKNVGR